MQVKFKQRKSRDVLNAFVYVDAAMPCSSKLHHMSVSLMLVKCMHKHASVHCILSEISILKLVCGLDGFCTLLLAALTLPAHGLIQY